MRNKKQMLKNEGLLLLFLLALSIVPVTAIAQQEDETVTAPTADQVEIPMTPGSPPLPAVVSNVLDQAHQRCMEVNFIPYECVMPHYGSDTLVVLTADLLLMSLDSDRTGYYSNNIIWQVVDTLTTQVDYAIDSILLGGQGSRGNPHSWYIVLTK